METAFKTEQEHFWAGAFGDEYTLRNDDRLRLASNVHFFSHVLKHVEHVESVIELGANIGLNLRAMKQLLPNLRMTAVEINTQAAQKLATIPDITVLNQSLLEYHASEQFDMALIKGVLIHIDPTMLPRVYDTLYHSTQRYLCIAEYYNPTPVSLPYRGHQNKLFKRDFAGEMLDQYSDLQLVDYGFVYHRDKFSQDDLTWFLLKK